MDNYININIYHLEELLKYMKITINIFKNIDFDNDDRFKITYTINAYNYIKFKWYKKDITKVIKPYIMENHNIKIFEEFLENMHFTIGNLKSSKYNKDCLIINQELYDILFKFKIIRSQILDSKKINFEIFNINIDAFK